MTALRAHDQRARQVADYEACLSQLASSLYAVENSLDLAFIRSYAGAGGGTGRLASEVEAALTRAWALYPVARDHVQQLVRAAAEGRRAEVEHLLCADAVEVLSGAPTGIVPLLDLLHGLVSEVAEGAARLAQGARRSVAVVDAATTAVVSLLDRAKALGAEGDVEVKAAWQAVENARAVVAGDPVTADVAGGLDLAMRAARQRVDLLEQQRDRLPTDLVQARSQLTEISRLVESGADALVQVRVKIAKPSGLLEPLDPADLGGDDRALAPWLASIERQAATGRWRAAAAGLEDWRKQAHSWLDQARAISMANRAPLVRRSELRGLLRAYEAKAAASGCAEDPALIHSGEAARAALHVTPCDLSMAEALVHAYGDALNDHPEVNRR